MATMTGVKGKITIGDGPSINVYEWEADLQRDIFDDSYFDEANLNARTKVAGMAKLVGRAAGYAKTTVTPAIGSMATENEVTGATFNLVIDDSATPDAGYTFSGLINTMTVDVIKIGLVAVALTFESQGAVANIT